MKTTFLFICIILSINAVWTQNRVGINTNTPEETLDVNGNIVLRGPLLIGGDDTTPGNSGEAGQFLISNENGMSEWKTIDVPIVQSGSYFLYNTYLEDDTIGVTIPAGIVTQVTVNKDEPLIDPWLVINNLTTNIEVPKVIPSKPQTQALNKLGISLLIKAQSKTAGGAFAIGLFIDGYLKSATSTIIVGGGANYPVTSLLLKTIVDDIAEGKHKIQIATRRLYSTSQDEIAVGTCLKDIPDLTINRFMMESIFSIDLLTLNVD